MAYIYVATILRTDAQEVFRALEPWGFQITHVGKHDPPRNRRLSFEEASEIVGQNDGSGTNTTFVADAQIAIELTFELRDDPRWGFSTISISFPDSIPAQSLGEDIYRRIAPYAYISGVEGAGKGQEWEVLLFSEACPEKIRTTIS